MQEVKYPYTKAMATRLHQLKNPVKGFVYAIAEYPEFLCIVVKHDNVMQFEDEQRAALTAHIQNVRKILQNEFGVRCEMEGIDGDIPRPAGSR